MDGGIIFFIFGVLMYSIVILFIMNNDKSYKILALITPIIIGIIVFGALFVKNTDNIVIDMNLYKILTEYIDNKLNAGLSIIGITVSVWVGLNIYSAIEKKDLERIVEDNKKLETKVNNMMEETEKSNKKFQDSLMRLTYSECSIVIKKENIDGIAEGLLFQKISDVISHYSKENNLIMLINRMYVDENHNDIFLEFELKCNEELVNSSHINKIVDKIKDFMKTIYSIDVNITYPIKFNKIYF